MHVVSQAYSDSRLPMESSLYAAMAPCMKCFACDNPCIALAQVLASLPALQRLTAGLMPPALPRRLAALTSLQLRCLHSAEYLQQPGALAAALPLLQELYIVRLYSPLSSLVRALQGAAALKVLRLGHLLMPADWIYGGAPDEAPAVQQPQFSMLPALEVLHAGRAAPHALPSSGLAALVAAAADCARLKELELWVDSIGSTAPHRVDTEMEAAVRVGCRVTGSAVLMVTLASRLADGHRVVDPWTDGSRARMGYLFSDCADTLDLE